MPSGSPLLIPLSGCKLDDVNEILIPEPFYPNYNTFVRVTGGSIRPIPTTPEGGYHYADRVKVEALINVHTRAIMVTNPGNPTGTVLTREEMRLMVDIANLRLLLPAASCGCMACRRSPAYLCGQALAQDLGVLQISE